MLQDSMKLHNECTDFVRKNKKIIDYVNEKLHGAKSETKHEQETEFIEKEGLYETVIKYCLHFCMNPFFIKHG